MEAKATVRPWQARPPIDGLDATMNGEPVGPVPATIAGVYRNEEGVHCTRFIAEIYNGDTNEGGANAALIVRCVNQHDALVKALKAVLGEVMASGGPTGFHGRLSIKTCENARAVLDQAKEE